MCMTQLENNLAFSFILTKNKIPMYFLFPITFKTYQCQYRSKYSIIFTQCLIEEKNFEVCYLEHWLSRTFLLVPWKFDIANVHCMFLIKRSWPCFSEPQFCWNHIYVIAIVKFSNGSIVNHFNVDKRTCMDSCKVNCCIL